MGAMSYKTRMLRQITDRLFPSLTGMKAELDAILDPKISRDDQLRLTWNLLKKNNHNFDVMLYERARRRNVSRGLFVEMGVGDWKIYQNDVILLLHCIKLKDYIEGRMICMDTPRFAQLCGEFEQRYATTDAVDAARIDAGRLFSFPPATMTPPKWHYWLKLAVLEEEEAVALSLGKDPEVVTLATIEDAMRNDSRPSPFARNYKQRLIALQRASRAGLLTTPISPLNFLHWARTHDFDVPATFEAISEIPVTVVKNEPNDLDDMNPKHRRTIRLLLLCMAIDKYGHRIDGNSTAVTKIVDTITRQGLSISRDTVKDALTDAADDEALEDHVDRLREHQRGS